MIQYVDYVYFTGTNDPIVNAKVSIYIANTNTLATLYDSTVIEITNPLTTDQTGKFEFYAVPGSYDIYYLGAKQYQIALSGANGVPDPLSVGQLYANNAQIIGLMTWGIHFDDPTWQGIEGITGLEIQTLDNIRDNIQNQLDGKQPIGGAVLDPTGDILFSFVAMPTAPSAADSGVAGNPNGTYYYGVSYLTSYGETEMSVDSNVIAVVNKKISLTNIPVSSNPNVTARRIYRTTAGGTSILKYLVGTINDNVTTTYTDDVADGSLGVACPRVNTTGAAAYVNGTRVFTVGSLSMAVGYGAMPKNTGYANTAVGANAMIDNTTGYRNAAFGVDALFGNSTGCRNTAAGVHAMNDNVSNSDCAAFGYAAAYKSRADGNSAFGSTALTNCTTGAANTAVGYCAARDISTGGNVTAVGSQTLLQSNGTSSTGVGAAALYSHLTGNFNTAVGAQTLTANTSGANNTVVGALGLGTNATGSNNVALGAFAGYFETGSNKLFIDNQARGTLEAHAYDASLIYGVFSATVTSQRLRFNARTSILLSCVPVYANQAAAIAGGLVAGDIYRNNADPDHLCIVH